MSARDPMIDDCADVFTEVEHVKCRDVSYAREVAAVLRDNLSKDIVVDLTAPDAERIANTLTFLADRLAAIPANPAEASVPVSRLRKLIDDSCEKDFKLLDYSARITELEQICNEAEAKLAVDHSLQKS